MQTQVRSGSIQDAQADAIVVNLFQGVTSPGGATGAVDAALSGRISRLLEAGDFKGMLGQTLVLDTAGTLAAPRVVLVGLGRSEGLDLEGVRQASAAAVRAALERGASTVATIVHGAGIGGLDPAQAAEATTLGGLLADYRFDEHKSEPDGEDAAPTRLAELILVERDEGRMAQVQAGAEAGAAIAAGITLARDLSNHPANTATPTYLAEAAAAIAGRHGMRAEAWDRARIIEERMGALASVAAGSAEEPRFIILRHQPAGSEDQAPVVLAGKGVTFDSGGISLKGGLKMGAMKMDMSGASAVLGAMEVVGRLQLPLHVVALVGATENLPGGRATKPGDVVRARNGTSIEILNTDAEGRMVLADALSYAQDLKPAAVVDLATLTGAILITLGKGAAGLFPNDDALADALLAAGERAGERLWRLPMWDEPYAKMIESEVADIKNTLDAQPALAGSIFGAKFLQRFTDYPWAHLDIAGMAWGDGEKPYQSKGATGYGVNLLVAWLRDRVDGEGG